MTAMRPPRCPRCNQPIPPQNPMGPRRKFCGRRSCYDAYYDEKRKALADKAEEVMKTEAFEVALLAREKALWKQMRQKVADVRGTEPSGTPRIVKSLPRGGALIVLGGDERAELIARIAELDEAVSQAAKVLGRARPSAYRKIARDLQARRKILERLGGEGLLGEIPEPRR